MPAENQKENIQPTTDQDSLDMAVQNASQVSSEAEKLVIDLAKELSLSPKKAIKAMVVKVGSRINKGELIAAKKTLADKKLFLSPANGVIEAISEKGRLTIRLLKKKKEKSSLDYEGETEVFEGDWGRGEPAEGVLFVFEKEADLFNLENDYSGKILVINDKLTRGFCYKAGSLGVTGVVCPELVDEIFAQELEKEILFLNGQKKDICLPILVLKGSGQDETRKDLQKLASYAGKKAILDGEGHRLVVLLESS